MGLFDKFKKGLSKTNAILKTDIRDLFKGEGELVNEAFLDGWFEIFVKTDMGVQATQEIVDEIHSSFRARVVKQEEVQQRVKERLKTLLAQPAAPIAFDVMLAAVDLLD